MQQTSDAHNCLMPPPYGGGGIISYGTRLLPACLSGMYIWSFYWGVRLIACVIMFFTVCNIINMYVIDSILYSRGLHWVTKWSRSPPVPTQFIPNPIQTCWIFKKYPNPTRFPQSLSQSRPNPVLTHALNPIPTRIHASSTTVISFCMHCHPSHQQFITTSMVVPG